MNTPAYVALVKQTERTQSFASQAPMVALHGTAADRLGMALLITEEAQRLARMLTGAEASTAHDGPQGNIDVSSRQEGEAEEEPEIRCGV